MSSKKRAIEQLTKIVLDLQRDLNYIATLEPRKLYGFTTWRWIGHGREEPKSTYGFISSFNKLSYRIRVVASENEMYTEWGSHNNIPGLSINYSWGATGNVVLTSVKRSELPLLVGMTFVDPLLADIMSGKNRSVKVEQ
jgi:hypothetical protein